MLDKCFIMIIMNKFINDADEKKSIRILTTSGILIALFVVLLFKLPDVKGFIANLFKVLSPFIWGILFAIITNNLARYIETHLPEKWPFKTRRFIGALVSVLVLVITMILVVYLLMPKLIASISSLSTLVTNFTSNSSDWIKRLQKNVHLSNDVVIKIYEYSNQAVTALWNAAKDFVPNILTSTITAISSVGNFVIGFIVCLYILIDKQKIAINVKRMGLAFFNAKQYKKGRTIMYLALDKFTKFFSGKVLDSLIIGILCFISMLFINKEYAALISVIVGITNIIPFFGPFIGAVPCALLLLIVEPLDCLIFIIMIIILQQVDGNIIGPAILGDSVGLSSLWIMFAILVGGAYFGFFGMLLGVPVVAVIYYVIKEYVDEILEEKGIDEESQE